MNRREFNRQGKSYGKIKKIHNFSADNFDFRRRHGLASAASDHPVARLRIPLSRSISVNCCPEGKEAMPPALQSAILNDVGTYRFFDHAADVGIALSAESLPDLFHTAVQGLMAWVGPPPDSADRVEEEICLNAEGLEELLVRWLQEILYLFQLKRVYWIEISGMTVAGNSAAGKIRGIPFNTDQALEYQEIKAVTYHQLQVREVNGFWLANIIIDI